MILRHHNAGQIDNFHGSNEVNNKGININHGWKIHADVVHDLTYEESLRKIGRATDMSIVDKNLADQFDKRLSSIGLTSADYLGFHKLQTLKAFPRQAGVTGFTDPASGFRYIDPNDAVTLFEVFQKNQMNFKMGTGLYGPGRNVTAYAQDIVTRDNIIAQIESSLGERLVDQNDPTYRAALGSHSKSPHDVGVKNHPLSRGVAGRFTTDYLDVDPNTGKVDFALASSYGNIPKEYKVTGEINPEQIDRINRVVSEMPEMEEMLHGPSGYISPYRTIEDIALERSSGAIPHSPTAGPAYSGKLPTIKGGKTGGAGPSAVLPVPPTPKPTPSNTPVAPVTPTKPKTPAPKPTVKPTAPKPKPTPKIKPGKILPPPGSPGGVVITPIPTPTPTPKPAPIPSSKSTKITPKVTPRRYPKPTPMRYDSDKLNKLRPLPKYKDVLVAGITASPGSSPAAVATAAATTPAGSSIAFRDLIKNKAKAISGSSVIKKYQNITNTKLTMGGIAAAGLATSIAVSKNRLSEKEKRR